MLQLELYNLIPEIFLAFSIGILLAYTSFFKSNTTIEQACTALLISMILVIVPATINDQVINIEN